MRKLFRAAAATGIAGIVLLAGVHLALLVLSTADPSGGANIGLGLVGLAAYGVLAIAAVLWIVYAVARIGSRRAPGPDRQAPPRQ
ncbi:hypothetical protein M3T53_08690 [Actinomyces sp. B33]|uniref:hypothetical protein n=1 Tax=Actinomyces sp. B33 TaxID=2942131 RepID=UPI002340E27A|nr:hypothetical protein [Actinomyces sp. B33]MDC4233778.1 hypothetical protein [Actinomyces sp. B33]